MLPCPTRNYASNDIYETMLTLIKYEEQCLAYTEYYKSDIYIKQIKLFFEITLTFFLAAQGIVVLHYIITNETKYMPW